MLHHRIIIEGIIFACWSGQWTCANLLSRPAMGIDNTHGFGMVSQTIFFRVRVLDDQKVSLDWDQRVLDMGI